MKAALHCSLLLLASAGGAAADGAAVVVQAGSVARDQVVAVGKDVVIDGETLGDVAAVNGDVQISGAVGGDVIVLGGEVRLGGSAHVAGDVFVLGGTIDLSSGASVDGRSVSYPTVSAAWLTLMEGPSIGLRAFSPMVLAAKFALLMAWMLLVVLLFATSGRQLLSTSEGVVEAPFRCFFVGLSGVLTFVLTGVLLMALNVSVLAAPLLVLLVVAGLLLKLWGMVAVFRALGAWCAARLARRPMPLNAAVLGLLILGLLKFLPWIGTLAWTVATLIGVGAALTTKFGRRESWFSVDDAGPIRSALHY